ncbi:MAG: hypothetical protein ACM32E_25795 [Gemmatimonadota bacterium]
MDDTIPPPGGDERANQPTEQFWPGQAAAPGHDGAAYGGPGYPGPGYGEPGHGSYGAAADPGYGQQWPGAGYPQQPGLEEHYPRDRRRALHWSAGLALVAVLAGGGAIAGVSLAGHQAPAPAATGQAAVLNAALNAAGTPAAPAYLDSAGVVAVPAAAAAGTGGPAHPAAAAAAARCLRARAAARAAGRPGVARAIRRACLRPALRALALRGVHGEFTFRTKNGFRTLAFERGNIQSVSSGQDIVVRAPDGTTWTWDLTASTVVRQSGQQTSTGALAAGEQVWAGGPVVSGAMDARLIVIRPPSGSAAPSPSGS